MGPYDCLCLRPEIRRAIKIFCQEFELDKDALDLDDWMYIQAVYKLSI
jgi:hypothetical protein